jgi:hypothetical protein
MLTGRQKKALIDKIAVAHDGVALPEVVVQEARNPKHPLHQEFDWNDSSAAHKHRLDTARHLIASVEVELHIEDVVVSAISYVHDVRQGRRGQGYCSVDALAKRREDAAQTMAIELERIEALIKRARSIALGLGLGDYLETALANIVRAKLRIEGRKRKKAA